MSADIYDELRRHIGHKLACVSYGSTLNVALECETCSEVLMDFDKPDTQVMEATEIIVNGVTYDKISDTDCTGVACRKCALYSGDDGLTTELCRSVRCRGFYLKAKNSAADKQ